MFDIGWGELAILASLALVVIGPKDLPRLLRQGGQMWQRLRTTLLVWRHNLSLMDDEWRQHLDAPPKPIPPSNPPKQRPSKTRKPKKHG